MAEHPQGLDSFDGTVRLFPLPSVVLFPQVMLPLHIFEPRYRLMTADALAGDRLISMVLLRPGWEAFESAAPPLFRIACLGQIVAEQRLDDGRFNLLLRGLHRIRIVEELVQDRPYRTARVEILTDSEVPAGSVVEQLRKRLAEEASRWFEGMGITAPQVGKLLQSDLALGALCDVLAFALPFGMEFKQELLEECSVERRVRKLLQHLDGAEIPKPQESEARSFPPDFSTN